MVTVHRLGLLAGAVALSIGSIAMSADQPVPSGPSELERLHACAADRDDDRRLACYDREVGRAESPSSQKLGMTADLRRREEKTAGLPPPKKEVVNAALISIGWRAYDRMMFTLDNGQVWAQEEALNFPAKVGDTVTITPGLLGAIWMSVPNHKVQTRVKRVK